MRAMMCLVLICSAANGQADPNGARQKRAARDAVVKKLGEGSRAFVEFFGEDAVTATNACSVQGGKKLAEFHDKGGFIRLPYPNMLLRAIGRTYGGDPVVDFVIEHSDQLLDTERMEAFCTDPLSYSLYVKSLETGMAERRQIQAKQEAKRETQKREDELKLYLVGGGVVILVVLIWRQSRRAVGQVY
jgi:hypothetical protein